MWGFKLVAWFECVTVAGSKYATALGDPSPVQKLLTSRQSSSNFPIIICSHVSSSLNSDDIIGRDGLARRKDFDTPWKEALWLYLPSFFEFFFPDINAEIDWSRGFRFLDKELRKLSKGSLGGNREADTLVELHRKNGETTWVLVHIEVQSQVDHDFPDRMFTYYFRIRDHYRRPVCSLAVLGDPQASWRPDTLRHGLWGTKAQFEFPWVKLLDFRSRLTELETSTNPFALLVASTLYTYDTEGRPVERRRHKFRLVRNLYEAGLDKEQIISFFRLVDWIMSLPKDEQDRFTDELEDYEQEKSMPYITSVERVLTERIRQEGRQEALKGALMSVLSARFGEVPASLRQKLEAISSTEELESLTRSAATAESLAEFESVLSLGD